MLLEVLCRRTVIYDVLLKCRVYGFGQLQFLQRVFDPEQSVKTNAIVVFPLQVFVSENHRVTARFRHLVSENYNFTICV